MLKKKSCCWCYYSDMLVVEYEKLRDLLTYLVTYLITYLLTCLLTYSLDFMEFEDSLPHLQMPATCPYPEPDNPIHASPPSYFLKIHLDIILPCILGSSKRSLSLRFPHQNPVCTSPIPHTCYMACPSHSSWFHHLNNIW